MSEETWEFGEEAWDFDLGDRVRTWSRSARAWKAGYIKSWLLTPYQRSQKPRYYGVVFDGTTIPRYCWASCLQRLGGAAETSATRADDGVAP